jgi:hypothetical protein
MKRSVEVAVVLTLLLLGWASHASAQAGGRENLKHLLAKQGFSGLLTGDIRLSELGNLACNGKTYRVVYYEWYESHPRGEAIHASFRLLLLDGGTRYVGSYIVEDRPTKVTPISIVFDYPRQAGEYHPM